MFYFACRVALDWGPSLCACGRLDYHSVASLPGGGRRRCTLHPTRQHRLLHSRFAGETRTTGARRRYPSESVDVLARRVRRRQPPHLLAAVSNAHDEHHTSTRLRFQHRGVHSNCRGGLENGHWTMSTCGLYDGTATVQIFIRARRHVRSE